MTIRRIKYRRRRKGNKVIIYTPEGFLCDQTKGKDAWKNAGKIVDRLNIEMYEQLKTK